MERGRTTDPLGRTALVTGAGTGIGRAIAVELASRGCRVALLGRRPDPLHRVAAEIASLDGEALPIPCDVTDDAQVASAVALARSALGPVEILVNNAGRAHSSPLSKVGDETWDRLMALNVRAVFVLAREVVPDMRRGGWGRIINVASIAAHRGWRYTAPYTASKHAAGGLTRSLAAELLQDGITVNAVCPGYVDTAIVEEAARVIADRTGRTEEASRGELAALNPIQRLIEPREVASAVLTFCGPGSGAISGQSLIMDGGSQPV